MNSLGMATFFDDRSPTPRAAVEALIAGELAGFGDANACGRH
jgi:hypothetical protein